MHQEVCLYDAKVAEQLELEAGVSRQPQEIVCEHRPITFWEFEAPIRWHPMPIVHKELEFFDNWDRVEPPTSQVKLCSRKFFLLN